MLIQNYMDTRDKQMDSICQQMACKYDHYHSVNLP